MTGRNADPHLKHFLKSILLHDLTKLLPCENEQELYKVLLLVSCKRDELSMLHTVIYSICLILFFVDDGEGRGRAERQGSDVKYKHPEQLHSFIRLTWFCLQTGESKRTYLLP